LSGADPLVRGDALVDPYPTNPIFQSIRDEKARNRLISTFDLQTTMPNWALGYRFNIVLRGPDATPFEE